MTISRSVRRAVFGVSVGAAAVAALMPTAFASIAPHISLASSSPTKDSHVMTPVKEIRLTFTGPVNVAAASVELTSADNKAVPLDSLRAVVDSPRVAVTRIPGTLAGGTYTVKWKAVADDGASGSGSFSFMYMPR